MIYYKVPATTANMGPGFDSMGMALELYNKLGMEETGSGLEIKMQGIGSDTLPKDETNLCYKAAKYFFDKVNYPLKGLKIEIYNQIPIARGLGSSSSIIVGALMCANEIAKTNFDKAQILNISGEIENHPDNIAPAVMGGIVVGAVEKTQVLYKKVLPKDDLSAVCLIPNYELKTEDARKILPKNLERADAIYNISRTALVVLALQTGDYDLLTKACHDKLHQPYRKKLIKEYDAFMKITMENGSIASFISGSGSTLMSLCKKAEEQKIFNELKTYFLEQDKNNMVKILKPQLDGAIKAN